MPNLDLRIAGKYRLQRRIGGGGFGAVYIGKRCHSSQLVFETYKVPATKIDKGEEVAIKLEHVSVDPSFLKYEIDAYRELAGGPGIPHVHGFENECDYRAIVFDLLGPSLEDLFNYCSRQFSLKTVLMLADQLLHRLEYIHSKGYLHRDVKPENFLMGAGRQGNLVYVTDLGFTTVRQTVPRTAGPSRVRFLSLIGTERFASVRGHLGLDQTRGDDLESLGYMLLYFLRGSLPWQGSQLSDKRERQEHIVGEKENITVEELCKDLPEEFAAYFEHVRSLDLGKPDYCQLRKSFRGLFTRERFEYDNVFDWTILEFMRTQQGDS
ncbi:MAG: hypothetical protein M4579_005438 [Chaenotheca gracillima]|nr:MAG: hypothetical protein M4579_005438 [Chaenotheca gracillima]